MDIKRKKTSFLDQTIIFNSAQELENFLQKDKEIIIDVYSKKKFFQQNLFLIK